MNNFILNTDIQQFINENLNSNSTNVLLKGTPFKTVSTSEIVLQIEAKIRCQKKLPTWFHTNGIYYPSKLNIEQTSSEITAKYKSKLIKGTHIIDVTGGFGVDCFYFSTRFKFVTHCEINAELSKIVEHNLKQLNVANITTVVNDGIEFLKGQNNTFDWIYIDPSRRHDAKGKVFFLRDCSPNVPEHLSQLFKYSNHVMIKTSPLLDISAGIGELSCVKTVHVIAVNNEVKELLWILEKGYNGLITIETANIKPDITEKFQFNWSKTVVTTNYSYPLTYVYEPNAAILKAGGFHQITDSLKVFKLHQHSHLYTSSNYIDFPGRIFTIKQVIPYNKKLVKRLGIKKANISTRNFPERVENIRKKFSIKDGGDIYLFFTTTLGNEKIVLVTVK